jgi:ABC-2 type transport system ATP-binding protein
MSIVTVRNLVKEYPTFRLNNVTFSLDTGKITGFIGRNGAGKLRL